MHSEKAPTNRFHFSRSKGGKKLELKEIKHHGLDINAYLIIVLGNASFSMNVVNLKILFWHICFKHAAISEILLSCSSN